MMLQPLMNNTAKAQTSNSASVQAPVKGWNAKDSLADMPSGYAIALENVFPNQEDVTVRRGHEEFADSVGSGAVESLMEYSGPSTRKLFAAGGGVIYDVTSGGTASSSQTGLTNNRWQHTMFGTAGGNFLFCVNGADAPRYFDGSSWTTPSLTGVTATDIVGVFAHQRRLFFVFNNSTSIGYLPVVSVAGAVSTFDFGGLLQKGGYIIAAGGWTRDGGSGPDDVAAFLSSEGEVILYSGDDPGTASSWEYVGNFTIPKPIGRRCTMKVGGDLLVLTEEGAIPLAASLPESGVRVQSKAASSNIRNAFISAARQYKSNFGWQSMLYPRGGYALINIPLSTTVSEQYVVNTEEGGWCKFKGQNAACWSLFGDDLYFGGQDGGKVYKADTGASDNNADIVWKIKPAFNYFGNKGLKKLFTMCRPNFLTNGALDVAIDLNVDFADMNPTSIPTSPDVNGLVWGTSNWGEANWAGDSIIQPWLTVYGLGNCATPTIRGSTKGFTITFYSYEMTWQTGNVL